MTRHISLLLTTIILFSLNLRAQESTKTRLNYATFNIRMDTPRDQGNSWQYRKDAVADYIHKNDIDLIGMQEVLHHQLTDLQERLPEYDFAGVAREDGKTKGEYAPIFYRKDKYEKLDSNTFWLSQYPDSVGFIGWDGACTRIATWVKLKDRQTGQVFLAINTHFDHVGKLARKNAALLIIDRIQQIAGTNPAILTGDFNVPRRSEAYRILTRNDFDLKDARRIAEEKEGPKYTFHNYGKIPPKKCQIIDFIFVTPQVQVNRYVIDQENRTASGTGYLSDHNPVLTQLEF